MFALEVEYLLGRVFAASFADKTEPEWPPHPSRLFSALASAYFENGSDPAEGEALEWLEGLNAPLLSAGLAGEQVEKVEVFVPANFPDSSVPAMRLRQPRYFPSQGPSSAIVFFIWPDAEPTCAVSDAMNLIAARTAALGRAASLVRVGVNGLPPEPTHVPDGQGEIELRVPVRGRLAELKRLFLADLRPSKGAAIRYRTAARSLKSRTPASEFGHILVLRKRTGPSMPIDASLAITEALRRALLDLTSESSPAYALLHGHEMDAHCAFVAFPFVGSAKADGHLLGTGVVFPRGIDPQHRLEILSSAARLADNGLKVAGIGRWELEAADSFSMQQNLRPHTWSRPSRVWQSVTPVLLDRFPKKKGPTADEVVAAACARIGLPLPLSIECSPYSGVPGVAPVERYRLRRRRDDRPRWAVHVTVAFAEPVLGPILLGAGRYFGLGLMRPMGEGN